MDHVALSGSRRHAHLHLVGAPAPDRLPAILKDADGRKEVEQLTQELVDVLFEMMDLVDGDPDNELNADEFDDDAAEFDVDNDGI